VLDVTQLLEQGGGGDGLHCLAQAHIVG